MTEKNAAAGKKARTCPKTKDGRIAILGMELESVRQDGTECQGQFP